MCSLVLRSNSLAFATSPIGWHYLVLNRTHSHSLALACTRQNSFALAHSRSSTFWLTLSGTHSHSISLACPPIGSHSLTFSRSLLNLLARCCKTIQFSLASFLLFFKWVHLLGSYQILWKYFGRCRRCDHKTKFKRMPSSGWIQLLFPIFTSASLPGPSYVSPCKVSAKSDYPQLSYCGLTNLS